MSHAHFIPIDDLEAAAVEGIKVTGAVVGSPAGNGTTALSAAISAKRTADALERIANAFDGQSVTGNVLYWLELMASSLHNRP